jgi:precorrin-6B methylase 2
LQKEIQRYIYESRKSDFRKISLQKSPFPNVSSAELAQQIKARQIAESKFPSFYKTENLIYPPGLNLEQSSSELTAQYKSNLVSGKLMADLTSGFGVDSFAFSKRFSQVISVEKNENLNEIVAHNLKKLGRENIRIVSSGFEEFLNQNPNQKFDLIYLDPSRRKNTQRKFRLEDLEPDILIWMNRFFEQTEKLMVKLSPLLDLSAAVNELKFVHEIHIVAVKNEVKELLLACRDSQNENPLIHCVNLNSNQENFRFYKSEESEAESKFSIPKKYIYEPNAAVLKSGAFKLAGERFGLGKLHPNTHLYTSEDLKKEFPGKIYEVEAELKNPKKEIEKRPFHLLAKNYPLKTEEIRKKYKTKEGIGETLIFTKSIDGNHIFKAKRIKFH